MSIPALTAQRDELVARATRQLELGNERLFQSIMAEWNEVQSRLSRAEADASYEAQTPQERRARAEADFMQRRAVNRYAKRQRLDADGRPVR